MGKSIVFFVMNLIYTKHYTCSYVYFYAKFNAAILMFQLHLKRQNNLVH